MRRLTVTIPFLMCLLHQIWAEAMTEEAVNAARGRYTQDLFERRKKAAITDAASTESDARVVNLETQSNTCDSQRDKSGEENAAEDCGCNRLQRDAVGMSAVASDDTAGGASQRSQRVQFIVVENKLVSIPGGDFFMGTDAPEIPADGEAPRRAIHVSPFRIEKMDVTNAQFAEFVNATGFVTESERFGWSFVFEGLLTAEQERSIDQAVHGAEWWLPFEGADWAHPYGGKDDVFVLGLQDHPVVQVSWNDAVAYCAWRGRRLPTEAEWEVAARGGKHDRMFPWGNKWPTTKYRANIWHGTFPTENTADDGHRWTAPVGSFAPQNKFGLHDIVGNVWEWVADNWTTFHRPEMWSQPNPKGPALGHPRENPDKVKKGGSYMCHKSYCFRYRVAARSQNTADSASSNLGFRCAADALSNDQAAE